jgi:hypothetical protein
VTRAPLVVEQLPGSSIAVVSLALAVTNEVEQVVQRQAVQLVRANAPVLDEPACRRRTMRHGNLDRGSVPIRASRLADQFLGVHR